MGGFAQFYRQFKVLAWKNYLLKIRGWQILLMELIIPVVIIIALGGVKQAIGQTTYSQTYPKNFHDVKSFDNLYGSVTCLGDNLVASCVLGRDACQKLSTKRNPFGYLSSCQIRKIAVTPSTPGVGSATDTAAQAFVSYMNKASYYANKLSTFTYFPSEQEFIEYSQSKLYTITGDIYSSAVVFNSAAPMWDYTLRYNRSYYQYSTRKQSSPNTANKAEDFSVISPTSAGSTLSGRELLTFNALGVYSMLDQVNSFITTQAACPTGGLNCNPVTVSTTGLANFPNKEVSNSGFWGAVGFLFALLMIISLLLPLSNVIKSLVQEKETKMREGMLMMALRGDALWVTWILNFMALFLPLSILLTISSGQLFVYSDKQYIFFYFMTFFISTMSYGILVSCVLSKSRTASIMGCLVYFMGFFIYLGIYQGNPSHSTIMAAMLHPACAFTFGTQAFTEYEGGRVGVTTKTWKVSNVNAVTFQDCLNMMIVDALWMLVLAWYLAQVIPSEFGTHRPWYFLFTPSYWSNTLGIYCHKKSEKQVSIGPRNSDIIVNVVDGVTSTNNTEGQTVERVPDNLDRQIDDHKCVHIVNLYKEFSTPTGIKTAVDGLNLTMYSGQITALLGHNGAGKTTAIGMLTGLFPPTAGNAIIEGKDINVHMAEIRKNLGVCPQHDILYPNLTVEEHLQLFASFKGVPPAEQKAEVEAIIQSVGLTEKRKAYSRTLSGGQKRKLSVGIAFIGGSRIVFLDEPTSGMDPYSRRFTWNVIRSHREGRVVVLTTHFMDEADLLGDRIAIMGDGKLRCCGSSLFLKNLFGVGYNMTVEKMDAVHFNSNQMIGLVTSQIPDAKLLTDVGTEITFQLPFSGSGHFVALFEHLDANSEQLGVRSYGMGVTSMEEVFIKVAEGTKTQATAAAGKATLIETKVAARRLSQELTKKEGDVAAHGSINKAGDMETGNGSAPQPAAPTTPFDPTPDFDKIDQKQVLQYFFRHMAAMLRKRALYFVRDSRSWIYQYLLPVIFVLIGMLVMKYAGVSTEQPIVHVVKNGQQQVYNQKLTGSSKLPTPYAANPIMCINAHPNSDDGDSTFVAPCMNVTYFTAVNTSMRNSHHLPTAIHLTTPYHGFSPITQSILLNQLTGASTNYPLVPIKNAANVSYMSYYLLSNTDRYPAAVVGALSFTNLGINGTNGQFSVAQAIIHGNFTCQYAGPMYSTLLGDAVLKTFAPASSISMSLHPLPLTFNEASSNNNFAVNNVAIFVLLAIPYIPAAFATFIVREREVKAKHQQLVSGVSIPAYWFAAFIWDNLTYQVTVWMIVILVSAFPNTDQLSGPTTIGYMIGLLILFGSAISGFTYLISFMFVTPSGAQVIIIFMMLVLGLVLSIVGEILRLLPTTKDMYMNSLRYLFALFPPYCLGSGFTNLALLSTWSQIELVGGAQYNPGDWNITGMNLTFLGWETVVYLIAAIAYEYLSEMPLLQGMTTKTVEMLTDLSLRDEDVLEEEERVRSGAADGNSVILVKDVKKVYRGGKYAVRGVSLGIPNGECFGLLGINGAGKSSCLNMLSGEFRPSSGEAYLAGYSLLTDVHTCRQHIGFCPQFDALFELLSSREHLQLYARIKGIAEKDINRVVDAKISEMGLTEYADRLAGTYSGGNKRKLSVAIAMIGEPSIVFLDEPSTGMDPVARRFMWEIISDIVTKREKCSVILTTHSMEECEALCTRMGIMVGGVLRCLGSSQRLRTRYGHGYQIEIGMMIPEVDEITALTTSIHTTLGSQGNNVYLKRPDLLRCFEVMGKSAWGERISPTGTGAELQAAFDGTGSIRSKDVASWWIQEETFDNLCTFLGTAFGGFTLRERQNTRVRVEVSATNPTTNQKRKFASMFAAVEEKKTELRIQEYSIAQTSLEQIFNQFAAQQEEEVGPAVGISS